MRGSQCLTKISTSKNAFSTNWCSGEFYGKNLPVCPHAKCTCSISFLYRTCVTPAGLRTICPQHASGTKSKQKDLSTEVTAGIRAARRSSFPAVYITEMRPGLGMKYMNNSDFIMCLVCVACVTRVTIHWAAHYSKSVCMNARALMIALQEVLHLYSQTITCFGSIHYAWAFRLAYLQIWSCLSRTIDSAKFCTWIRGLAYIGIKTSLKRSVIKYGTVEISVCI